jgi:hypothetical protein
MIGKSMRSDDNFGSVLHRCHTFIPTPGSLAVRALSKQSTNQVGTNISVGRTDIVYNVVNNAYTAYRTIFGFFGW